jgi:protein PsiE
MKYSVYEIGEKLILLFIGVGAFLAAMLQIVSTVQTLTFEIEQLFILFIYAEVIGMVGAYISSSRIPLTLPIIIAITALCRLIVMQSKETEALVLISESASILLLSIAAYVMSLKGKISIEKLKERESKVT